MRVFLHRHGSDVEIWNSQENGASFFAKTWWPLYDFDLLCALVNDESMLLHRFFQ